MTGLLGRRDVVRLAGLAGLGAVLDGCTDPSSDPVPNASGSAAPSPAPRSPSSRSKPTYAQLAKQLSGDLARPGQSGYRARTLLYNPRFFSQPAPQAIAHVNSTADVAACVRFAADGGAPLRMRNGGHSYGGWSSGPALVVDLAKLTGVSVDRAAMTATIGAGALLADVYSELGAQGVSIGGGSCSTVGVTGLTLGGGVGVLARTYGLACDQLAAARVVTADGKIRTTDEDTDADLFWALQGGGGSFGAVTELIFNVRAAPRVQTFLQWSWPAAAEVLSAWQAWMSDVPRELWSTCKLLADPGKGARVLVAGTWVGSGSPNTRLKALLGSTPEPAVNDDGGGSYGQTMLAEAGCSGQSARACIAQALTPANRQPFAATSSILAEPLPSKGIAAIVAATGEGLDVKGMVEGGVSFDAFGGAIAEVAADATAFPCRTALADVQYTATWPYASADADPAPFDAFVQSERTALLPWLGNSAYVNCADRTLVDFATAYSGPNLPRLSTIKKRYDPYDVFSFPQSVPR
ncbi:MAG TPA: FAD-dependent oxidoreductase [Microlunatus sp.]